ERGQRARLRCRRNVALAAAEGGEVKGEELVEDLDVEIALDQRASQRRAEAVAVVDLDRSRGDQRVDRLRRRHPDAGGPEGGDEAEDGVVHGRQYGRRRGAAGLGP